MRTLLLQARAEADIQSVAVALDRTPRWSSSPGTSCSRCSPSPRRQTLYRRSDRIEALIGPLGGSPSRSAAIRTAAFVERARAALPPSPDRPVREVLDGRGSEADSGGLRKPWEGSMLTFLTVLAVGMLLVAALVGTATWRAVRRVRRSRLVTVGRDLAADGAAVLAACRPGPTPNRLAAARAVRIAREHQLLRQRVERARRAGAHLGDVPALLPRLEAEGRRLRAALGQLVGVPVPGDQVVVRADRHLATLADLSAAVAAATAAPSADESLAQEAEDAARGLRLHREALSELTDVRPAPGAAPAC